MTGGAGTLAAIRAAPGYADAFTGDPLVSVRIPTFRRARLLTERALPTVLTQSYPHLDVVIVGDATDDDTAERVAALADPRVRFHNLRDHSSYPDDDLERWLALAVRPMNAAIDLARGAWIAAIDDDDEWDPDHVEILLRAAQRECAEVAYAPMRVVVEGEARRTAFGSWPPREGDFGWQGALHHAGLHPAFRQRSEGHAGVPADWDLAQRMLDAGVRFTFVDRAVGTYHVRADYRFAGEWRRRVRERPYDG
jgi:glycosyltransferase involved in cell wall biosynthesis